MRRALVLLMCLTLGPAAAIADELAIKPGMWESTTTRLNPMTGKEGVQVTRSCVEADSFDPESLMQDAEECRVLNSKVVNSTLTFEMACSIPTGAEITVKGTYQTSGETGAGEMEMNMSMGPMTLNYKADWESVWVGEC